MCAGLRKLEQIYRCIFWQLVLLCPSSDRFKISACVLCVEIDECVQTLRFVLHPNRPEYTDIHATHQALPKEIEAVRDVPSLDIFRITEGLNLPGVVILIVVKQ